MVKTFEEIEQAYFIWLCSSIGVDSQGKEHNISYWLLIKELYNIEFYAVLEKDMNRSDDVIRLRERYVESIHHEITGMYEHSVSVFELILAVAHRVKDAMDDLSHPLTEADVGQWFWHLIRNLELWRFNDINFEDQNGSKLVSNIVYNFLSRTYNSDGQGGLFPIIHPEKDQTKLEIWYQMMAYLLENWYVE